MHASATVTVPDMLKTLQMVACLDAAQASAAVQAIAMLASSAAAPICPKKVLAAGDVTVAFTVSGSIAAAPPHRMQVGTRQLQGVPQRYGETTVYDRATRCLVTCTGNALVWRDVDSGVTVKREGFYRVWLLTADGAGDFVYSYITYTYTGGKIFHIGFHNKDPETRERLGLEVRCPYQLSASEHVIVLKTQAAKTTYQFVIFKRPHKAHFRESEGIIGKLRCTAKCTAVALQGSATPAWLVDTGKTLIEYTVDEGGAICKGKTTRKSPDEVALAAGEGTWVLASLDSDSDMTFYVL